MNIFDQLHAQMRGTSSEPLPTNTLVIDVRSAGEYAMGHVEGAINIPVDAINAHNLAALTDKNQALIVYCAAGMRAAAARSALLQLGYTQVINAVSAAQAAQMVGKAII